MERMSAPERRMLRLACRDHRSLSSQSSGGAAGTLGKEGSASVVLSLPKAAAL